MNSFLGGDMKGLLALFGCWVLFLASASIGSSRAWLSQTCVGDPLPVALFQAKIPIGSCAKLAFDWMKVNLNPVFDFISAVLEGLIGGILWILHAPPSLVVIAVFVALTWWMQRNIFLCLGVALGFFFIVNQGYWKETTESLTLILAACVVCMGIGVPVGIAAAHRPRLYAAMSPVLDMMQTLPTFVYLIPAIVFFGLGMVPGLIATVIFVLPAPIRLTQLGVASTPTALLEAATAFGATPSQRLWKVELPYALPQIMAGMNQTIMLSLSMVVISAMVGANGLGIPVMRALQSVNAAKGFESGFVIVVVAIVLDRMLRREVK
jgi:glycine betaine/proline transport system permease protein